MLCYPNTITFAIYILEHTPNTLTFAIYILEYIPNTLTFAIYILEHIPKQVQFHSQTVNIAVQAILKFPKHFPLMRKMWWCISSLLPEKYFIPTPIIIRLLSSGKNKEL